MSEWKTYTLDEFCEPIRNGYSPNSAEDLAYIGLEHIEQQTLRLLSIGKSSDVTSNKFKFESGDVLFGKLRPYFRKVYRPNFCGICSTDISVFRAKKNFDTGYLFYLLATKDFIDYSNSVSSGTRMPRADWNLLKKSEWSLPDLKTQQRIASILSSLDDAIELNQQINKTLEEMAKAIFKEWFVDFNFPNATGKFQETEIGKIPVGWKPMKLNEALEIKYGKDHKHLKDGEFPVYGSGGIMRYAEKPLYESESILIPRKGTLSNLFYINKPFWTVDTMFYSKIKIKNSGKYLFHLLQTLNLASMNVGSAVPSLTTEVLNNIQIAMPDENTLKEFEKIVSSLFNQAEQNIEENQSLINLRDTLLPKLMKGEININLQNA